MIDPEEIGPIDTALPEGHTNEYVSVSRLKLFQTCPKQFRFRYVDKADPDPGQEEPAEFGKIIHAALEDLFKWVLEEEFTGVLPDELLESFFRKRWQEASVESAQYYSEGLDLCRSFMRNNPDVDHFDILAVEEQFQIQIGPFEFFGFIDRVNRLEGDIVEVQDYKTNRLLYDREDLALDLQASIYLIVARKLWPWAKGYRFRFDMLRHGISQHTERSSEELEAASKYAVDTAHKTERPDQTWPAKLNNLCSWCGYRRRCEEYQAALKSGLEIVMVDVEDLAALSAQREAIASIIKPLEGRKKEIDKILKQSLEHAPNAELQLGNYNYRVINVFQKTYPFEDTIELLERYGATEEDLKELMLLDKKKVEDLADKISRKLKADDKSAQASMFLMELKATAEQEFWFSRFDSKVINKSLAPAREIQRLRSAEDTPPPEYSESIECSFCKTKPAKEVERGGETFNVCKDHSRKRKPPKAKDNATSP